MSYFFLFLLKVNCVEWSKKHDIRLKKKKKTCLLYKIKKAVTQNKLLNNKKNKVNVKMIQ